MKINNDYIYKKYVSEEECKFYPAITGIS